MTLARTVSNLAHLVVASMAGRVLAVVSLFLALRVVTPDEYARLGLFLIAAQFLGIPVSIWTGATLRYGREEHATSGYLDRTLSAALVLRYAGVAVSCVLVFLFREELADFTHLPVSALWWLGVFLAINAVCGLGDLLQAQERFALSAWSAQLPTLVQLAAVLLIVSGWLPPRGLTLIGAAAVGAVGYAAAIVIAFRPSVRRLTLDALWLKAIFLFALPFTINAFSVFLLDYADAVTVRVFMPLHEVGIYTAAQAIMIQVRAPIQSLSPLIMPKLISMDLARRTREIDWFYGRIVPQVLLGVGQLAAAVILLLPVVAVLLGPRFRAAADVIAITAAGLAFVAATWLATPMFYVRKQVGGHIAAYTVMATVNTTCSILLIPRWGIYGAALARVCADVCGCFLHGLWLRRLTPAPFLRGALWSSPAWIVGGSLALGAPWWTGAALWAATSLALLALARRAGLFDEVSANFFGTLGLPRWLAGPLLGFYRRRLISPPPAAGFAT